MKKGQTFEGIIERVDFPNKGIVYVPEEGEIRNSKERDARAESTLLINKFKRGNAEGRLLEVLEKVSS